MKMQFRTQAGQTITYDPALDRQQPPALEQPMNRSDAQVEVAVLLRKEVEGIIRAYGANPADAAVKVIAMLDQHLDLAEGGWLDNDELMQQEILRD